MLFNERQQLNIPFSELKEVDSFFKRHTNIDLSDIPKKYGTNVTETRDLLIDSLKIDTLFQCFKIDEITETSVSIETNDLFSGKMPPKILNNASHVFCFVASICDFEKINDSLTDPMKQYFFDIWGTAFIENASLWLKNKIDRDLAEINLFHTPAWNPGQHQFELNNQRTIFKLLKPEDIGLNLTSRMKMVPIKSVSGIIGILEKEDFKPLIPCDFCKLGATCPASESGCSNC